MSVHFTPPDLSRPLEVAPATCAVILMVLRDWVIPESPSLPPPRDATDVRLRAEIRSWLGLLKEKDLPALHTLLNTFKESISKP